MHGDCDNVNLFVEAVPKRSFSKQETKREMSEKFMLLGIGWFRKQLHIAQTKKDYNVDSRVIEDTSF